MKSPVKIAISILVVLALCGIPFRERIGYGISRAYQELFVIWQYNYYGLDDPQYGQEISFQRKAFWNREYESPEIRELIATPEIAMGNIFYRRKNSTVSHCESGGHHYIVKHAWLDGFCKNLFKHNRGVTMWNTAHWGKELGLPMITPVALIEKRRLNHVETFFIYEYRKRDGLHALYEEGESALPPMYQAIERLIAHRTIHQDLRPRNIVEREEGEFEYIDLDVFHRYPTHSYIYWQRYFSEREKFNADVIHALERDQKKEL